MENRYKKKKVFIAACIGMCFFGVSMIILGSILPSLTHKLALNPLQATSLVTFLPLGVLLGSFIFGPFVDHYGHKAIMLPSCIIVLLGLEGLTFFCNIHLLQFSIVAIGFGGGILNGETNALVVDISKESERGSLLSLLGVFYGVGALCVPVFLGSLLRYFSFEFILNGVGLLMLIAILYCFFVRFPAPKQAQKFPIKDGLRILKGSFVLLCFILFFQSGIEGVCNNWTTSYFNRVTDISLEQSLFALTCMVASMSAARLFQVILFKKVNPQLVFPYSLMICGLGFLLLTFSPGFLRAALGMILIGAGLSSTFPIILSIIGNRYPSFSGTAFSIALAIALIGQTTMNALMGMLSHSENGIRVYPYLMILSLILMLLMYKCSLKYNI